MFSEENPKRLAQIVLIAWLIVGCFAVLLPFIGAILFAFVLWICTWPAYTRYLLPRVGGRRTLGATVMTGLLILVMLLPMFFLVGSMASGIEEFVDAAKAIVDRGLPPHPPELLKNLPIFGVEIDKTWHKIATSRTEFNALMRQLMEPTRRFMLATGKVAGNGLLQLMLVLFVTFFLYRDGYALGRVLKTGASRLGGKIGEQMLEITRSTVVGVMLGIVGTAAGQSIVATIGFLIAGVPAPLLLGFATFFLSMVPVGPPIIWGIAATWLYSQGQTGWAIFMVFWGLLIISSIDNFLKPVLMARGAGVPILLIALGVFGGILVFGFIGMFLGPVLLALGHMLILRWTSEESNANS